VQHARPVSAVEERNRAPRRPGHLDRVVDERHPGARGGRERAQAVQLRLRELASRILARQECQPGRVYLVGLAERHVDLRQCPAERLLLSMPQVCCALSVKHAECSGGQAQLTQPTEYSKSTLWTLQGRRP